MRLPRQFTGAIAVLLLLAVTAARGGENLIPDPSFEQPQPKDRFGHVFAHWSGWIYEGTASSASPTWPTAANTPC